MLEKKCKSCKQPKILSLFCRDNTVKSGRKALCRDCENDRSDTWKKTKDGVVSSIYNGQKYSSKKRGHIPPTYTKKELKDWLMSEPLFHVLYDNWKRLDYQGGYKPSVDRKDDYVGYTMANIQLMTWQENEAKAHVDVMSGKLKRRNRAVSQYTKTLEFIEEYHSSSAASRHLGINQSHISACCKNKRKTAGGFKWRYA